MQDPRKCDHFPSPSGGLTLKMNKKDQIYHQKKIIEF
ncbi:unnamed protein product, partial [Amoebophrya sp. A120]|eukprot:GSA120T00021854001.1